MSAVVTVVTLPLVALYFNQFPWVGLLTNLAAVPVMGPVGPMGLAAVVWQGLAGGDSLPCAQAIQWSMDALVLALRLVSVLPGAEWHGPRHPCRLSCSFTDVWPRSPSGPIEKHPVDRRKPVSSAPRLVAVVTTAHAR